MQYYKWHGIIVKIVGQACATCYVRELETNELHIVNQDHLEPLTPEESALIRVSLVRNPTIKFTTNCGTEANLEINQQDLGTLNKHLKRR